MIDRVGYNAYNILELCLFNVEGRGQRKREYILLLYIKNIWWMRRDTFFLMTEYFN